MRAGVLEHHRDGAQNGNSGFAGNSIRPARKVRSQSRPMDKAQADELQEAIAAGDAGRVRDILGRLEAAPGQGIGDPFTTPEERSALESGEKRRILDIGENPGDLRAASLGKSGGDALHRSTRLFAVPPCPAIHRLMLSPLLFNRTKGPPSANTRTNSTRYFRKSKTDAPVARGALKSATTMSAALSAKGSARVALITFASTTKDAPPRRQISRAASLSPMTYKAS